jgi:PAS domain S-box-containing protein
MSSVTAGPASMPSANVLLVDDRADKLLALESILSDSDHRIVTARSGAEALRALLRDEFAVILLDVNMPQLDGFQTASLIRGRPRSEKTPIIFMTAVNDLESGTARGYSLGAVDYIHLPVAPEVLRAKVSVFVELFRKREQIRQQAEIERLSREREHARRLAEAADRVDFETRRNRFFTLAPDMLGVAGFDGRLRQLNESWQRTLGIAATELCASPVVDFLHPDDRQAMRDQLRALSEGAPTARFENRHRHGDGSYKWLSWTAAAFREEGLVYVFVRDITFRKVAEEERLQLVREQEARRAAERENERKDQFLATLSHELRSPLTPILGWTSMLRSGRLAPADAARALEVIERNARVQAQLVEDLLDVNRIVSGKLRMDMRPCDLRAIVEAGLEGARAAAAKRRIALAVELGDAPVAVVGDPARLQQVVWNLASNAVKFSDDGGTVRVALDVEGDLARLCVSDDGIGISEDFLPHVFQGFRQATGGSTRTHGGLGLGLTIARHIVQAHGGTVVAQSGGVGRGATFTVAFPRARGAAQEGSALAAEAPGSGERIGDGSALLGRVVLVVDDECDVRDVLQHVLERSGARVVSAGTVAEALAAAEADPPDLVVSDIGMPGADGYALLEQLRARPGLGRPAAVALSAYASHEDAARSLAAGFRAHLAKPVDAQVVVETLAGLLRAPAASETKQ